MGLGESNFLSYTDRCGGSRCLLKIPVSSLTIVVEDWCLQQCNTNAHKEMILRLCFTIKTLYTLLEPHPDCKELGCYYTKVRRSLFSLAKPQHQPSGIEVHTECSYILA